MAAVELTFSGVLYDKYNRTTQNVVMIGEASLTGFSVGGGPVVPPEGGKPPGIWGGGNEPFPTPPIVIPPQNPGEPPLVIWGPNDPRPTPPIVIYPGGDPNPPVGGDRVKLVEWKTAWTPETGWVVIGIPQVPHPAPSR